MEHRENVVTMVLDFDNSDICTSDYSSVVDISTKLRVRLLQQKSAGKVTKLMLQCIVRFFKYI